MTVATLNPATMEILQLFRGDTIIVRYVTHNFVNWGFAHIVVQRQEEARHCSHLFEFR